MNELETEIRSAVRQLCSRFGDEYWRALDAQSAYPDEFVRAMTAAGYLAVLIPEAYGGSGLGIREASVVLEEINRSGGNAAVCHAQLYIMGTLLRHGSEEQKQLYLPKIATGELRLQAFGVTEPDAGSDTTSIRTEAVRTPDGYVVNGQKIWTSRVEHSDLLLLLVRTTPLEQITKKTDGLSLLLVDLRAAIGHGVTIKAIRTMINHHTAEVFFDNLHVPFAQLIGEEGQGFRYLLDSLNAERILIAAESLGDGYWFIERTVQYANQRIVFGRPIGQNQGIQFPLAQAYANIQAADLMRFRAADLFDSHAACGPEANMAKLLAADAAWQAANAALQTHGGFGFAAEYDIERKFRETRLYQVAPISTNLVLAYIAHNILKLPKSY